VPGRRDDLRRVADAVGIRLADTAVCKGHHAPLDFVEAWCYDRPNMSLVCGPRGGGKSFLSAFATWWDSLVHARHGTNVLGGSLAQSQQVRDALDAFRNAGAGRSFAAFNATSCSFVTGSTVSILAASSTSVRGPHVPTVRLDEVDEIDPDLREAALGMCMARNGVRASVTMTSTHHRLNGPMAQLLERSKAGEFPSWTFCTFEVLERCPDERSGPNLEKCPECPIQKWCHEEGGTPKAKRSDGHYAIDSLIQKAQATSLRTFEAEYLCRGVRADGIWFPKFNRATHVGEDAEYLPGLPVLVAIDCGTSRFTGATFLQLVPKRDGTHKVQVFADYLGADLVSEANAEAIKAVAGERCNGSIDAVRLDPASKQRTGIGPIVYSVYDAIFGRRLVAPWPLRTIRDSIDLLASFVEPAAGGTDLRIHPRCQHTIDAMLAFRKAKVGGVFIDAPEREQHPVEDMIDALKGGLCDWFPRGRVVPQLAKVPAARVF
jgi:hypothetical protein